MDIGWIYNYFAIMVTTAWNSGVIGFGCPELLLIGRDQLLKTRQNDFGLYCEHNATNGWLSFIVS